MEVRLTTGQAIVRYLMNQYVEFDGVSVQVMGEPERLHGVLRP